MSSRNAYRDGKKQINILVSTTMHRQLLAAAAERDISMQSLILDAIRSEIAGAAQPLDAPAFTNTPLSFEEHLTAVVQREPLIINRLITEKITSTPFEETP